MSPREVRPPMFRDGYCACVCHSFVEANAAELAHWSDPAPRRRVAINGLGSVSVDVTLPIEAVTACPACRGYHAVALSGRPQELDTTRTWNPPPLNPALPDEEYDAA